MSKKKKILTCTVCGSGPFNDGKSVFRKGAKSEDPDWRCLAHIDEAIEPELFEMVAALEGGGEETVQ